MRILGIDPGLSGAAAVYDTAAPASVEVFDLLTIGEDKRRTIDERALARWIDSFAPAPDHAFIEFVTAMREWGAGSIFRFGMSFGSLRTTVALCAVPYTLVVPIKWKKHFGLRGGEKEQSRQKAIQLFPQASAKFELVKHHQRAEAALIALYGARTLGG